MKKINLLKIIIISIAIIMLPIIAQAGYEAVYDDGDVLKDWAGTEISSYSLTSGNAITSETLTVGANGGFSAIIINEAIAGDAGDVDVYVEYSLDASTWYRAYESDMEGTITAEGLIVEALGNTDGATPEEGFIIYTPRPAPFMRYKFDPDANSEITARHMFIENR